MRGRCLSMPSDQPPSFWNVSVEGGARSHISQSINYTIITPLNSKAWVLHRIRWGNSSRHNTGATYTRVVMVGFICPRGCKRRRSRIQTATFSAATAAGPSISTSLIKLRGITFNRDAPTPSTYRVGFNNSIRSSLAAQGKAGEGVCVIKIATGHRCLCDQKQQNICQF